MKLVFALHNHQPVGNLDDVMEAACDRAYRPLLDIVRAHREVIVSMHYSGALIEWLDEHRPDVLESLGETAGSIDWLGGAFYEPILPATPEQDRIDQIRRLHDLLAERWDARPEAAWIPERVWDPSLAGTLNRAGYRATLLDDTHLPATLTRPITRPVTTDQFGRAITVLPISTELRHAIPDRPVAEAMDILARLHEADPDGVAVFADDGEKFGLWPESAATVEAGGWLDEFFGEVRAADWLESISVHDAVDTVLPSGRVSIPAGSYTEMNAWSDGSWFTFLDRYPEADLMNRKMLRLSRQLRRGASDRARRHLLRSQCNCAWWHGSFGGIYLPHLRSAVHTAMIDARIEFDSDRRRGRSWAELERLDWDADADFELHAELPDQSWVLDPSSGGSLAYYDDKPGRWPVSDVMGRRRERHHDPDAAVDVGPLRWLLDRHAPGDWTVDEFAKPSDRSRAGRFEIEATDTGRGTVTVALRSTDGTVHKRIVAGGRRMELAYQLEGAPPGRFGPELPVSVWEGAARLRVDGGRWLDIDRPTATPGHRFRFRHEGRGLEILISLPVPGELFAAPLVTELRHESGVSDVTQGIVLWPHYQTSGDGRYELTIEIGDAE